MGEYFIYRMGVKYKVDLVGKDLRFCFFLFFLWVMKEEFDIILFICWVVGDVVIDICLDNLKSVGNYLWGFDFYYRVIDYSKNNFRENDLGLYLSCLNMWKRLCYSLFFI